jgi:hypothetical protein
MRRIAPVLALLVLAAAPTAATAAARLVSPVGGSTAGSFPTLRWKLPAGEENEVVYLARRPSRAGTGEFRTENLEDTAPMSGRTTSHRMTNGLYAGTHYWLVGTRNADFEQQFSKVGRFRVLTSLAVTRVRLTPGATAGTADVRMRLKTNARTLRFTVQVRQAGRVVQTFGRTAAVLNPGTWGSRKVRWVPSSAVTSGRAATLRITIRAGSRTAHATLNVTAP